MREIDSAIPQGLTGEEFESLGKFIIFFAKDHVDANTHNDQIVEAFRMGKEARDAGN